MTMLANSKSPLTTRKRIAKGKPLFRLESAWGDPAPLVNMAGDYALTVLGDGSGPYDLIVITTGGVTQYALALKADLTETPDFPIAQEYVPFVSTRPPYEVKATVYQLTDALEAYPGFVLEPIGATAPAGGFQVFVLVHGGPLQLGNADNLIDLGNRVAGKGGIVFLIDYRSMPSQGANYPATVWDVGNAIIQARTMKKPSWQAGVTLVAHSFGGYPSSILSLGGAPDMPPAGLPDAYVAIAAISSTAGVIPGTLAGAPDPLLLGNNRPGLPVTVVRGANDFIATADNKNGFALALHNGDHPGRNVLVLGADHESVLMADVTLDAIYGAGGHA